MALKNLSPMRREESAPVMSGSYHSSLGKLIIEGKEFEVSVHCVDRKEIIYIDGATYFRAPNDLPYLTAKLQEGRK